MARYISFIILLAILALIGVLFYRVMIGFFIPVFIAVVLVVVFQPLHQWVLKKVKGRPNLAASITTLLIVGSVLVPAGLILGLASVQGLKLLEEVNESNIRLGLSRIRSNRFVNLESPTAVQIRAIDNKLKEIKQVVSESSNYAEVTDPRGRLAGDILDIRNRLVELPDVIRDHYREKFLEIASNKTEKRAPLQPDERMKIAIESEIASTVADVDAISKNLDLSKLDSDQKFQEHIEDLKEQAGNLKSKIIRLDGMDNAAITRFNQLRSELIDLQIQAMIESGIVNHNLDRLSPAKDGNLTSLQQQVWKVNDSWQKSKENLLGGRLIGLAKEYANPSSEQVRETVDAAFSYLQPKLLSFGGGSLSFLARLLVGLTILLVSLYFFFCDGPAMVRTMMDLSPLDDRYETELLAEFNRTSRAIVLATILSAVAQGLTAGIAYYFIGVPSAFLLTALTIIFALIPFVGTAMVWVPVAIYLAMGQDRVTAAIILALYALIIVGTIDNIIKMFILHGQSQLHPLLALLSVLGGLQALGPIGILVGPLAVTLLQTTLSILRRELSELNHQHAT